MKRDQILAALPSLSQADLRAINAASGALMAGRHPVAPQPFETPQGWLAEALQGALGLGGAGARQLPSTFNKQAPTALAFMVQAFGPLKNKTTTLAIMRLILGLLVADLKNKQVKISVGSLSSNLGRVQQVFEEAYPGYLENGIASLVLQAIQKGK